jgi:hypothetical protein
MSKKPNKVKKLGNPSEELKSEKSVSEPTIEQWTRLFEAAKAIKLLAPWNFLWDSDLITIMIPEIEEPIYCSVMGRNGECYAIGIYPGYESIKGFYRLAESYGNAVAIINLFKQNCLMCNFGDREEISPEDRKIYKTLGLKFRGRNEWIYFRSMIPGHYPWHIDAEEAELLIQVLQNLFVACKFLSDKKIKVNFDNGESLLHSYSQEKKQWLTTVTEKPPNTISTTYFIIEDELFIADIKKQKKNKQQIEFDIIYLPTPVQEHKKERPYLPRMFIMVGKESGFIFAHHIASPDEATEFIAIEIISAYIKKHGRPSHIHVRDEQTSRYIADFCQKIGVKLVEGEGLSTVDMIITEMLDYMN